MAFRRSNRWIARRNENIFIIKTKLKEKLSNEMNNYEHQGVLIEETINALNIKSDGIYIDGTFGRGGHSSAILNCLDENGKLVAIDKDEEAISYGTARFAHDKRFSIVKNSFANIDKVADDLNICGKVSGVLLDLGVSSPQLDDPLRGFSFTKSGPLDMRMDKDDPLTAKDFVNTATLDEMCFVFKAYGEEKFAKRIAKAIIAYRENQEITTTDQLAEIVKQANPKWEKHKHPATRVFQAIRIYVNRELSDLEQGLENSVKVLTKGGRLAVISFHSLEDRIVKNFMRNKEKGAEIPKYIPIKNEDNSIFKRIGKALRPRDAEVNLNPRARSAVLRVGEKLQ